MDAILLAARMPLCFLVLLLLLSGTSSVDQKLCQIANPTVEIQEGNKVGVIVATIDDQPNVTLKFLQNSGDNFILEKNKVLANKVLDYEIKDRYELVIECSRSENTSTLVINVNVININDNKPTFSKSTFAITINEFLPIGASIGLIEATDADDLLIQHTLQSDTDYFKLRSATLPDILVAKVLDYDKVQSVKLLLYAEDKPLVAGDKVYTATATVMVTVKDVDNRPPWFKPCDLYQMGMATVCIGNGYTGDVVFNEVQPGILPLEPGPLYAVDGDSGINDMIVYSFVGGTKNDLFQIDANTGNITMVKPAISQENIVLKVLATQKTNPGQVATTSVTIRVTDKSNHPPRFEKAVYEGFIHAVGSMATDSDGKLLKIIAKDKDYAANGGLNPYLTYSVKGSEAFAIFNNFLFLTSELTAGTFALQVEARDTSSKETTTANLKVDVTIGLTSTTLLPTSTAGITYTTPDRTTTFTTGTTGTVTTAATTTTEGTQTTAAPSTTSQSYSTTPEGTTSATATTTASTSAEDTSPSTAPSTTEESLASTTDSSDEVIPVGTYRLGDMAALGASLGTLLFLSLVVIAVLAFHARVGRADWKKVLEAAVFRSSLGPRPGPKDGIQFTNEAFQKDDDDSGGTAAGDEPQKTLAELLRSSAQLRGLPDNDNGSQAGSDMTEDEKGVKPILTKERRFDDGYKSVWFKEDIDPTAAEEVVIIPDESDEDKDDETPEGKSAARSFAGQDLDSGLGVKLEEPSEDSESDQDQDL